MRFCFIIEEQYKNDAMPMVVAEQLRRWNHEVDLLEPHTTITSLFDLTGRGYDAYVLKTVSDGPGLSLLEAAEAVGIPTINNSRAIRLVRDKAVAAALAHARGLPIPPTYFVAHPHLLHQIPLEDYPLVIKPTNGSSCRGIYLVDNPADLATLQVAEAKESFYLAQRYVENSGFDVKMYVTGTEVYAAAKRSPLHPEVQVSKRLIPVRPELRNLALSVGQLFGLDIYGLDVVETTQGPVVVDINDFPSFGPVPGAVARVSMYILQVAKRVQLQRMARIERAHGHRNTILDAVLQRLGITHGLQPLNGRALTAAESKVDMRPL